MKHLQDTYRVYRGMQGESIPILATSITPAPELHSDIQYPFAALARKLGARRDQFASLVAGLRIPYAEAEKAAPFQRWMDEAGKARHL